MLGTSPPFFPRFPLCTLTRDHDILPTPNLCIPFSAYRFIRRTPILRRARRDINAAQYELPIRYSVPRRNRPYQRPKPTML